MPILQMASFRGIEVILTVHACIYVFKADSRFSASGEHGGSEKEPVCRLPLFMERRSSMAGRAWSLTTVNGRNKSPAWRTEHK